MGPLLQQQKSAHVQSPRERMVLNLFPIETGSFKELVDGIVLAIHISHKEHPMRSDTDADKRQRFKTCMDWAVALRGDLKWGVQRIVGAMPEILRTTLSGGIWEPSQRQCWIPEDGR